MDGDHEERNVTIAGRSTRVAIVQRTPTSYVAAMREALARLLLIAAILFMPIGMAAPAAALSPDARTALSAMEHCSEEGTADHRQGGVDECTMACAAALPAIDRTDGQSLAPVAAPSLRVLAAPLTGLHPETATPPPRLA